VEAKDYEEVRDIREELLQVLRLLEEEDLSLLLEVVGVVLLREVIAEAVAVRSPCQCCNHTTSIP
jgi:hypothetical protein